MTRLTNTRATPELPKSETMGGKMGGTAFKASRELGLTRVSASWLLAFLFGGGRHAGFRPARIPCLRARDRAGRVAARHCRGPARGHGELARRTPPRHFNLRGRPAAHGAFKPRGALRAARNARARGPEHDDHAAAVDGRDLRRVLDGRGLTGRAQRAVLRRGLLHHALSEEVPRHDAAPQCGGRRAPSSWWSRAARRASSPCSRGRSLRNPRRPANHKLVAAGQSLASGASGAGAIATVVKPQDAVQWVLRYPPISDGSGASRAEELLRAGSVDDALDRDRRRAARRSPRQRCACACARSSRSPRTTKAAALRIGEQGDGGQRRTTIAPGSRCRTRSRRDSISKRRSRARCKRNPLQRTARSRTRESPSCYCRSGDARRAEEAARAAVASNPVESHAHSILGFVHLAQIDTKRAHAPTSRRPSSATRSARCPGWGWGSR